jgi:L-gulonate 5-dehydrogenase
VEGGFCDCFVAPEEKVHALPEGLPWERLALVEPYSIAAEVLARGEVRPGDRVLVIGAGTIGLCILQGMRIAGAEVLVTDFLESRLEVARRLGATRTVNGRTENLTAALGEFSDNFGVDVVVEAVGHPRLLEESLAYAAPGGRIVVLGFHGEPARIPEVSLVRKELKIVGSRMSCGRFPQVIEWFREGKVDPEALISATYPFERIGEAFRDILKAPEQFLKVVLTY